MSKTKYPNQIDTPSELPIVRDNIFEIGSDAINSLRSAIIQIEKTLGINPQGAIGMTVGDRISQSLDYSGNIRKEALDIAGIISGPVYDDQVSEVAAIKETKLKLDFPTKILQSEISYVSSLIDEIQKQIEEISSKLSAHLSPDAINRHPAKAISTTIIANTTSSSGIREFPASNVQSVLEGIFSSHINYDGIDISSTNNSHSASQIYFDNTLTADILSNDVQGAIEEASAFLTKGIEKHQDLFHSNGFSKTAYISDKENSSYGVLLSENSTVSILQNLGEKPYFEITLDSMISVPAEGVGIGDIIELTVNGVSKEYQIYKVQNDINSGDITGFWLFGIFFTTEFSIDAKIFLRRHRSYNSIGLLASNRENYGLSSSSIIQIINPDAPFISSFEVNPAEITSSNRYFDIKINGTSYSFDAYSLAASTQSIDSVIKAINETVDQLGLPILAYRINIESGGSEIVIAHNISSLDDSLSSLEIVRVDGAIDSLGLSSFESKVIYGQPGSSYYIDGKQYTGLLKKLDLTGFDIDASRIISSGALGIDFTSYNIKKGDVVNIIDLDVKSYEVVSISASSITLSSRQLPSGFSYSSVGTARLVIYESTISADSLEFLSVGIVDGSVGVGASLLEVSLDSNRGLNLNLILEQESELLVDKSIYSVINFYNPENLESVQINFENTIDSCVEVWLDDNQSRKKIVGDFNYLNLKSNIKNFNCDIYIQNKSELYNYAVGIGGSFSRKIYLSKSINKENNLLIAAVHYSNFIGKFDGGINGALFVSKLNIGNLGKKDLSTEFKSILLETPIKELRSSGFIFGLETTEVAGLDGYASGIYLVSISDGVCYVDGKRFEILGGTAIYSGIDASTYDKLYVGINSYGKIVFAPPDPNCLYPWEEESTLLVATIENDGANLNIIDQRLFIDNLDLKLLNSISVSPQPGMGHFSDLSKALKYAKRFSQIYSKAGIPEIYLKSGTHNINLEDTTSLTLSDWFLDLNISGSISRKNYYNNLIKNGIFIDFPASIRGEGSSSVVEIVYKLTASDQTVNLSSGVFVAGQGFNTGNTSATVSHTRVSSGKVSLNNFYIQDGWISLSDINFFENIKFEINNIIFNNLTVSTANKEVFYFGTNSYSGIVLSEIDNITNIKGNVTVTNCSFITGGNVKIYPDTTPSRYCYISIINCFTSSSSGISTPSLIDASRFPSSNKVYSLSNITSLTTPNDRISSNLTIGNNLSVRGTAVVSGTAIFSGSISVGADIYVGTRTFEKTYWLYNSQMTDAITTPTTTISATDAFAQSTSYAYRIGRSWIGQNLPSGENIYVPKVRTDVGDYCSIPVDISKGQSLKSIRLIGGLSSAQSVKISIVAFSNTSDSSTVIYTSSSISRNSSNPYFDLSYSYIPSNSLYHIIMIENTSATYVECSRLILTYESANLFDILGIS